MEKYRFYLDLPGDFWEGGQLMRYLKERQVRGHREIVCRGYNGVNMGCSGGCGSGGQLMRYLKERWVRGQGFPRQHSPVHTKHTHNSQPQVPITWDADAKAYVMPWGGFTRLGEVRTELQLMDPSER